MACGAFYLHARLVRAQRFGRDDDGQSCLIRFLLVQTADDNQITSQARHLKRISRLLFGILLKGLVEFRMEVFKRDRIYPGKRISLGFLELQSF